MEIQTNSLPEKGGDLLDSASTYLVATVLSLKALEEALKEK